MNSRNLIYCFTTFISVLTLAGCSSVQDFHQHLVESLRSPGETIVVNAEEAELFHQCPEGSQNIPAFLEMDTIPNRVNPGEEINYRIRYVLCLADQSAVLDGEIIRAVSYKDKTVFSDSTKYAFKSGIWIVDAFVLVPENVPPGTYIVNTTLTCKSGSARKSNTFEVKSRQTGK